MVPLTQVLFTVETTSKPVSSVELSSHVNRTEAPVKTATRRLVGGAGTALAARTTAGPPRSAHAAPASRTKRAKSKDSLHARRPQPGAASPRWQAHRPSHPGDAGGRAGGRRRPGKLHGAGAGASWVARRPARSPRNSSKVNFPSRSLSMRLKSAADFTSAGLSAPSPSASSRWNASPGLSGTVDGTAAGPGHRHCRAAADGARQTRRGSTCRRRSCPGT